MLPRFTFSNKPPGPPPRNFDPATLNDRVRAEFECSHPEAVLTFRLASNGVKQFKKQCRRCGAPASEVFKHTVLSAVEKRDAVEFDDAIRTRWWERRSARYAELRDREMGRESRAWWAWYNAYLESPAWQEKREAVLGRAKGRCEGCLKRPAVQVHHLTYQHVGDEFLFELVAVCRECHARIHPSMEDDE